MLADRRIFGSSSANRRDQATRSSTFPVIAIILCLCLSGFLISCTIVLALIPVFLPEKTTTVNENAFQSKENAMIIGVNEGSSSRAVRRQLDGNNCTEMIGGEIRGESKEWIRQIIIRALPSTFPKCRDIVISKVTIELDQYSSRRKRHFPISRRAASCTLVVVIKYYIRYKTDCFSACQKIRNHELYTEFLSNRAIWKNQKVSNVLLYKNGSPFKNYTIAFEEFYWMSNPNTDEIVTTTTDPSATGVLAG